MKVVDAMNPRVIVVTPDTTLRECVTLLREKKISGVPVVDGDELVGMITENDILKLLEIPEHKGYWLPSPLEVIEVPVREIIERLELRESITEDVGEWRIERIMKQPVHTVDATADVETASEHMIRHKINRLPVVDDAGVLIGIITRGDIIKAIAQGT
ncbi:MAG: CBS domain-containing protein [Euryarchaeota archaeon]|nr:CBS domain-containing protein [Euryarchaeota archaeon]